jgi:hypothetical protein
MNKNMSRVSNIVFGTVLSEVVSNHKLEIIEISLLLVVLPLPILFTKELFKFTKKKILFTKELFLFTKQQ